MMISLYFSQMLAFLIDNLTDIRDEKKHFLLLYLCPWKINICVDPIIKDDSMATDHDLNSESV